jgi:transposase
MGRGALPASKKKAEQIGAYLLFLDEAGFMLTPTVRRTLAPRGQTPIVDCWDRRDRLSAISGITVSPVRKRLNLYFHILADHRNAHAEDTVDFLEQLCRHLRRPLVVVWDGSNIHDKSRVVSAYLQAHPEIGFERLPAYAPELNPDEQVWNQAKYGRMSNYAPQDTHELRATLQQELMRLKHRQDLLAGCIAYTGLSVAA